MNHTRLILIRHGETVFNAAHRFDGQENTRLTDRGVRQADELGRKLAGVPIDIVACSPLSRAIITAQAVQNYQQQPLELSVIEAFKEIDCGDCTGMVRADILHQYPELIKQWKLNTDPKFPSGECLRDVESRAMPVVKGLLDSHCGKTILISGHGALNKAILGYYLQIPHGLRFKLKQNNCCINTITFRSVGDFVVETINS